MEQGVTNMLGTQDKKRSALKNKLSKLFNSNPEISYNMSVRSGLFRVAVTEEEVTGFLDDKPIKSIKIEDLDEEIREALENNPEEAGELIMEEFINAHKEGKLAMSDKIKKEARAGDNNYEDQLSGTTERQLKDAGPLYDREEEERKDITEKQLGDKSYDEYEKTARVDEEQKSITEKQIEQGKNPNPDTSPREDDERDSITQKQLDKGKVSTRRDDEKTDITEKQLEADFRNDEIKGITEKQLAGDEQDHDKVLVRRLANKDEAIAFAKKVAKATAKTIKTKELEKENTLALLKASVKNFTAQKNLATKLAQMMDEPLPPEDLDMESPEDVGGEILSDEEIGGSYESDLIVNVLKSLVENPKFATLVDEAMAEEEAEEETIPEDDVLMDEALGDMNEMPAEEAPPLPEAGPIASSEENVVEASIEKDNEDNDGLIAVEGSLEELKKASEQEDLEKTAFEFSRKVAGDEISENMDNLLLEIDEENGVFRTIFINSEIADMDSDEVKELMAKREKKRVQKIAESLRSLEVKAQAMPAGGGIPNLAPGGEPGGGGTTMPPGPADMGLETPPVESFDSGMEEGEAEDISGDNEPSPPGTRCPVCGSDDVDVENGVWECNNCESNGDISISMNTKRWTGTLEDNKGTGLEEEEGLGTELGEEETAMPMAASIYNINKGLVKEAINSGKGYINVGEYCPNCGSDNTEVDHVGNGKCFSCSQLYISKIAHKDGEFKGLTIWQPIPVKPECPDCKAKELGEKIAKKYIPDFVKTAGSEKFPYIECVNKIGKRYGLNAVALSGDCAGKPLVDCICKKMKSAGRYSQSLMIALASRLTEKDPMEECIEDQMRDASKKITIKEACATCEKLRNEALANMPEQEELEFVASQPINKTAGIIPGIPDGTGPRGGTENCPFSDDNSDTFGLSYDIDNFEDDMVTLSPEDELLDQIRQLLEVMRDFVGSKTDGMALDEDDDTSVDIVEDTDLIIDDDDDKVDFTDDNGEEDEVEFEFEINDGGDDDDDDDGGDDDGGDDDDDGGDDDDDDDGDGGDDEAFGGKIPGVPDGTGPGKDSKKCPFNKDKKSNEDNDDEDNDEDDDEEEDDEKTSIESEAGTLPPALKEYNEKKKNNGKKKEDADDTEDPDDTEDEEKDEDDKGKKSASSNNSINDSKEGKVMDLDKISKEMSGKKIKRYSEGDVLTTADTMQINDLLGDRKISDQAAEKEVERVTSQDTKDVDKYQDGKTMGAEEKFDAKDPDVPERGSGSTMGEGEEMPEGKAKIPAGEGAMRKEDEIVDTDVSTEADGRVASSKSKKVTAGEKKVEDPKPVDQSKDLKNQKLKDTMEMGAERETGLTPDTLEEPDVPTDNQLMGPDESKDMQKPSVPAGDGGMGHEDETVGTDVSVETKGTVLAEMEAKLKEAEVKAQRMKLATNLAALELMDGEITQDEFDTSVSKLATSSVQTLKMLIERYQNRRAKKIEHNKIARKEETVRDAKLVGLETPLIIEKQAGNLKDQIMGLFSLEQTIRNFEENK